MMRHIKTDANMNMQVEKRCELAWTIHKCCRALTCSFVRMHGYARLLRNPLQTNVLRDHHGDL